MEIDENMVNLKEGDARSGSCDLSFRNVTCKVASGGKKPEKTILHDVSGIFKSGKLTAILGPSGAGKSTLLNILAGYKTKGVSGDIFINGKERSYKDRWNFCFISQKSSLFNNLTVRETLTVAADLKISTAVKSLQKEKVISDILNMLNLQKSADTRVEKLSGGEKKRLSIGLELVTNPPIMFFDEPTSGLDSVSSIQVVTYMKQMALSGRTIVSVIHQPSSKIFQIFDEMILLSEGRIIYGGSVNDMVTVFQSAGFVCPQHYNRADFALEVASLEIKGDIDLLIAKSKIPDSDALVTNKCVDLNNDLCGGNSHNMERIDHLDIHYNKDDDNVYLNTTTKSIEQSHRQSYAISQWRQLIVLTKRSLIFTFRDLYLAYLRIALHIGMGIWLGIFFYQIGDEGSRVHTNVAFLFFLLLFIYSANTIPTVMAFPVESAVFNREILNNCYSLPAYYFSKLFAEIPMQIICSTLFLLTSLFLTGQPMDFWRITLIWITCLIFAGLSHASALIASAAFKPQMALFAIAALNVPMFIFSGLFVRLKELPQYMYWISYTSYFAHGYEAVIQIIYGYDRAKLQCSAKYCHFIRPEKLLKEFNPRLTFEFDVIILLLMLVFLHCFVYLILYFKVQRLRQ